MNRFSLPGLLTLAFVLLAGCATRPPHEFDSAANFTAFKTFKWLEPAYGGEDVTVSHPVLQSPLLGQRVERAAIAALEAKGFRQVEDNPDFLVTFHTAESETERHHGGYVQLGYGRFSPHWGSAVLLDMTPRNFKEGTLIIDIVDASTEDLVWRGWRDAYLTQRNFNEEQVNETVRYILSAFPPGP